MSSSTSPSKPSDEKSSDSNDEIIVVAKMSLYLTDDGRLLVEYDNMVDIDKRIQMLRAALQAEEAKLDAFLSHSSGYYC